MGFVGREVGARGVAASGRFSQVRGGVFEARLLEPLGLELDLLHHVAEGFVRRELADAGLETASERAQRLDDVAAPGRDGGIETGDVVTRYGAAVVGQEQEKEQEVDVDIRLVLKR